MKTDDSGDLLEMAWGIIANAGWDECAKSPGWQDAAVRWRNKYFAWQDKVLHGDCRFKSKATPLLGRRVKVWLDRKASYPAIPDLNDIPGRGALDTVDVIVEGVLIGFGDGGDFEIMEDDGFVYHCWPMLEIEEVKNDNTGD
jgi:hypothetical protein